MKIFTRLTLTAGSMAALMLAAAPALATAADDDSAPKKDVRRIVIRTGSGGFLGIGVAEVDTDRAKELGLKDEYGVEVKSVVDDSAAAKAGVKEGDVVLEYNGQRLEGTTQFIRMVKETPSGRQVKLLVNRDGKTMTLSATLEERKPTVMHWKSDDGDSNVFIEGDGAEGMDDGDGDGARAFAFTMPDIDIPDIQIPDIPTPGLMWNTPRLGIETESLHDQLADYFGVKSGLLVRSVISGSAAEKAGLKAGDVITKIGDKDIARTGAVADALRSVPAGQSFQITLVRNKKEMTLSAKLDEKKQPMMPHKTGRPHAKVFRIPGGDEI
jgi:serine protease Do